MIIKCIDCGKEVETTTHNRLYCDDCKIVYKRNKCSEYYYKTRNNRKENIKRSRLKYEAKNLDRVKQMKVDWRLNNPKKLKEAQENYKKNYPERLIETRDKMRFNGNRIKALQRDGFTCCDCGSTENLEVHHLDGVGRGATKPNNNLKNLVTLCDSCHTKRHHLMKRGMLICQSV